jgi:predicted RNA-binding Zn ribbon-like protein
LALIQSFLNTRWDLNRDQEEQLSTPIELARWLRERGLLERGASLGDDDLGRALDVREGLRALLFVNNGAASNHEAVDRLNHALSSSKLGVRFGPTGPPTIVSPGDGLDAALASLASIVAESQTEGSWSRLKACRGVHCGWAFYDHSRNQSGSWCSMSLCGSRTKAREYRRRKRGRART